MNPLLEVKNVSKTFRPPFSFSRFFSPCAGSGPSCVNALTGVSFTVEAGTAAVITGPNGAGKTTLLKILSTLIVADSGTVTVGGYRLGQDDGTIKSMTGFASSDDRSFYWRLTGRQNLEFFAAMYGLTAGRARARIRELCGLFEVTYQDTRFDSYSSGMKQKFSLMRSLLHDPPILLLDEPAKSLDYHAGRRILGIIRKILIGQYGKTVIFTTHHPDEYDGIAHKVMSLKDGRIE